VLHPRAEIQGKLWRKRIDFESVGNLCRKFRTNYVSEHRGRRMRGRQNERKCGKEEEIE